MTYNIECIAQSEMCLAVMKWKHKYEFFSYPLSSSQLLLKAKQDVVPQWKVTVKGYIFSTTHDIRGEEPHWGAGMIKEGE